MSELTNEQAKELAIKGAEALGFKYVVDTNRKVMIDVPAVDRIFKPNLNACHHFDPANNANHRDMLIEHFKIDVDFIQSIKEWQAENNEFYCLDKSRTKAVLTCLCNILEIDCE